MGLILGIHGITGKMGKRVLALAKEDGSFTSILGTCRTQAADPSFESVTLLELTKRSDVIIDFSSPEGLRALLEVAAEQKTPLVIGTTGLSCEDKAILAQTAKHIPLLYAANFSLGIAALESALAMLSEKLSKHFSIDIVETHHVHKKDAPSGTALSLARSMGDSIPIKSIREGEVIGAHQITFFSNEEIVKLSHEALSRDIFAKGALFAAKALAKKGPGLYTMKDIL